MKLGLFGGMFDPVHLGHVGVALEVCAQLALDELRFIPCAAPPHRDMPVASSKDRVAMLERAIAGHSRLSLDSRELDRAGPSWSYDTVQSIATENPDATLVWVLGADAFAGFDRWHRWQDMLALANLAIVTRPEQQTGLSSELQALLKNAEVAADELMQHRNGKLAICKVGDYPASSTEVRARVKNGQDIHEMVMDEVADWIRQRGLYQNETGRGTE